MPFMVCLLRWLRSLMSAFRSPPSPDTRDDLPVSPEVHAWAALDQCDILAELELLQLAQSLQEQAQRSGGYEGESFDVMVTIADLLEREHGWSLQQSDDWLERMGLYQD
jgi:hypothetical protein